MNETEKPETRTGQRRSRLGLFAASAGLAVALAAGGLYAFSPSLGNLYASETGPCAIDSQLAARIDSAATGQMAAFAVAKEPVSLAELSFTDAKGQPTTLADWSGKTVLLNLWATWCAPCVAEMPALDALNAELGGEKFEVLPISLDIGDLTKPKEFYARVGLKSLGLYHDSKMKTLATFKPLGLGRGLPATVLIDPRGCVLGSLAGPAAWESEDAKALVKAAL